MIPSTSVTLPIDREIPKEAVVKEKEPVREEDRDVQADDRPEAEKFRNHLSALLGTETVTDGTAATPLIPDAQKSGPKGTDELTGQKVGNVFSTGPASLDTDGAQMLQPTVVAAEKITAEPVATSPVEQVVTAEATKTVETDPLLASMTAQNTAQPVQPTQQVPLDDDGAPSLVASVNGTAGGNANGGALANAGKGGSETGAQSGNGGAMLSQNTAPDASTAPRTDSQVARQAELSFQSLMNAGRDNVQPQMTFSQAAGGMDASTQFNNAGTAGADPMATVTTDTSRPATTSTASFQASNLPHRGATPAAEQVAVQVSRAVKDGQGEIRIRMHPEELGRVDVKMEVAEDGRILAVLKAERPETLDILRRDVAGLEKALQEAGLDVGADSFTFDDSADGQAYAGFDDDQGANAASEGSGQGDDGADDPDASVIPPEIAAAALGEYRAIGVNVTV